MQNRIEDAKNDFINSTNKLMELLVEKVKSSGNKSVSFDAPALFIDIENYKEVIFLFDELLLVDNDENLATLSALDAYEILTLLEGENEI